MSTVAEDILQNVKQFLLDGDEKPSGLTVNRSRYQPQEVDELPIANVYAIREVPTALGGRTGLGTERRLLIRVRIWHASASGETDSLIEPIRDYVVSTLLDDLTVGGKALDIAEDLAEWEGEGTPETDFCVCDVNFVVRYATKRGKLTEKL